jgi:hypothetical protein
MYILKCMCRRASYDFYHARGTHGGALQKGALAKLATLATQCKDTVELHHAQLLSSASTPTAHRRTAVTPSPSGQGSTMDTPTMPLLGSRVVINGLVAKPELNGRTGTAVTFDDDKGRYSVALDGTSSSFMIKPCNLLPTVCSVALCSLLFSYVQALPRLS